MFSKLKGKLKNWTKSLSKKAEETEKIQEEPKETVETQKEIKRSKEEKHAEKRERLEKKKDEKERKHQEKLKKKEEKKSKKDPLKKEVKEIEEISEEIPEIEKTETIEELIETPKKFNTAIQGYEPDLEKIKKTEEELSKSKKEKEVTTTKKTEEQVEPKEKKSFFKRLTQKVSKIKFSKEDFEEYSEDLEMLLIENNVALEVSEKIVEKIKNNVVEKEMSKKEIESEIQKTFKEVIEEILIEPFDLIEEIKDFKKENNKPYKILFCGINGTGKTTSIAKLAYLLQKNNLTSVLAAGDTFRAASIEQIKKHGEKLGINVIAHEYGSDPASVGFDAIKYAEKNNIDVVLIDTAGRMHTEKNLMMQIEKVTKVTQPNTKIFVGESITGNDIVEQVKAFNDSVKIDGIILSKADIDEKGGTALSVGYVTKKPILYLGVGQEMDDIVPFNKEDFIKKLGLGN